MRNKRESRICGIGFLIIAIAFFISINGVNGAYLDDYIAIANANASVENAFAYGDYIYVVNDTDILKYYLEDGTFTDSYQIIDFMDTVHEVLERSGEVYIDFTTSGSRYIMCFDLDTFTEVNRTLKANIDNAGVNHFLWDYICWEVNDIAYWFYSYSWGTGPSVDAKHHVSMQKGNFDEILPYTAYGVYSFAHGYSGNSYGFPWYHVIYVYNTSSGSTETFQISTGSVSDHVSVWSYSTVYWNNSGSEWIQGTSGDSTTYLGGGSALDGNQQIQGNDDCYTVQNEFDSDGNSYSTFGRWTIRGKLVPEGIPEQYSGSNNKYTLFWDKEEKVFSHVDFWGGTTSRTFYQATNSIPLGFISWSTFTINYEPRIRSNAQFIGSTTFGYYETYTGYDNYYIGYVNQSDRVPIAERIVLASGNDIVSSFDYDDVVDCYIHEATLNLVAVFTRENDTNLYFLRNLIDRDELASGGYTTPTLQFISANLYTIVGGEKVVNDGWLFMGEVYQLESVIQNMTYYYLELDDGENIARFYFENSTKSLNVTCSDEFVAGLTHSYVETVNATLERYGCEWRFILDKNIVDNPENITITYYGENTLEEKTVSGTAITGLKIYNLGGFVSYDFGGDGSRVVGGDALELTATDGNQSSYAKAEIIFRKLQHVHLLVEIDMDNDFDTDHLDFPLGCGFAEYGFDYRLDGVWVTGWKAKIYVTDARVGRYGIGTDASWVEISIDWYNKAHQSGIIKTDKIYAYHYGYDKDADYAVRKSIILWVDLWFNRMNASTVIGGRVNSYEHGMYEAGSAWWFGYGEFRPKIGNATASMFFDDLYDGSSDITNCKQFELIKMWGKVEKINDTDGNDDTWTLKNYEILNWKLADDRMEGVDTPVFVETKDPSMPKTGFISPIVSAIQGISTAISKAMFNMVKLLIGAMDSLLINVLHSPVSMSQMINWIMIQGAYITNWMANVIAYTSVMLNIFAQIITFLLQIMGAITNAILWVITNVVGFPLHILRICIAIVNGSSYTIGDFTFDFTGSAEIIDGAITMLSVTIGFMFVAWILWGTTKLELNREMDIEGIPKRIIQMFGWIREMYNNVFWIFNRMRNEIISLYNFIRSHIPQIGGGGGKTEE